MVTTAGPIRKLCMDEDKENTLLGPECDTKSVTEHHNKRQNIYISSHTHTHTHILIYKNSNSVVLEVKSKIPPKTVHEAPEGK
jgi:hypothetical protein